MLISLELQTVRNAALLAVLLPLDNASLMHHHHDLQHTYPSMMHSK